MQAHYDDMHTHMAFPHGRGSVECKNVHQQAIPRTGRLASHAMPVQDIPARKKGYKVYTMLPRGPFVPFTLRLLRISSSTSGEFSSRIHTHAS